MQREKHETAAVVELAYRETHMYPTYWAFTYTSKSPMRDFPLWCHGSSIHRYCHLRLKAVIGGEEGRDRE